jgi:EmrB/QacA subfamily drug resistance transporter
MYLVDVLRTGGVDVEHGRRWWVLVAISLGTFMTYLDNNVVNVALPTIQRDLGLSISGLEWIVSGYILVFAGLMLVGGRLADLFGRGRAFLIGLAMFTVASLLAGLAGSEAMLLAARVLQGAGAALLTPAALAILPAAFTQARERAMAIGIWSAVGALALAFGPLTGGFISQHWQWGWIYLINVPIGVVTFALGVYAIREVPDPASRNRRLDLPGLLTSSIALVALTFGLIEGERRGWTSPAILGAFAVAVLCGLAFWVVERSGTDPMVDLSLFRSRLFSGGTTAMGLWAFGIFGIYFYTALYLQNVLGLSPVRAGAAFVPMALVLAVVASVSGPLAARIGNHITVAAGLGLMAIAVVGLATVGRGAGVAQLMPWFLLYGLGGGALVPLTTVIVAQLPPSREGVASGILNVSREVFGLLGVTILGAILSTRRSAELRHGADPVSAFLSAYRFSLIVAAVVIAVGVPVSLWALRTRRADAALEVAPPAEPERLADLVH